MKQLFGFIDELMPFLKRGIGSAGLCLLLMVVEDELTDEFTQSATGGIPAL